MMLSTIISHIKTVENDNSADTTLLQTFITRFAEKMARNIEHTSLLFSASATVTTGNQTITLATGFIKPLDKIAAWLIGNEQTQYEMARIGTGISQNLLTSPNSIFYIKNNKARVYSSYTGSIGYYYFGKMPTVATSAEPAIPAEYLIEGARAYYKEAMGLITSDQLDARLYAVMMQAQKEDSTIDDKISAYMYNSNPLTNSFRSTKITKGDK